MEKVLKFVLPLNRLALVKILLALAGKKEEDQKDEMKEEEAPSVSSHMEVYLDEFISMQFELMKKLVYLQKYDGSFQMREVSRLAKEFNMPDLKLSQAFYVRVDE